MRADSNFSPFFLIITRRLCVSRVPFSTMLSTDLFANHVRGTVDEPKNVDTQHEMAGTTSFAKSKTKRPAYTEASLAPVCTCSWRSFVYVACWCWCKGQEIPIYIWYESYPTHSGEGYEGRVSRVSPNSPYGVASLNLTDIRESDQGWYECKVVFLNRSPNSHKNGTWFHLDVHGEYFSFENDHVTLSLFFVNRSSRRKPVHYTYYSITCLDIGELSIAVRCIDSEDSARTINLIARFPICQLTSEYLGGLLYLKSWRSRFTLDRS